MRCLGCRGFRWFRSTFFESKSIVLAKSITAGFGGLPSEISEEENEQERSFLLYGSSLTRDLYIRII